jgi:glycosyltransferase involved in cell wall biosynthesis
MKKPLVSVIVPSFNSAATIEVCLNSIKSQIYSKIEIVVVDKGSQDQTVEIAKKYTTHVYTAGPERSAQVNFGARKARGKYLYRVDSDFILQPNIVSECVELCESKHLDGAAVHNTSAQKLGFWADVRGLERDSYRDDDLIVAVRFFTKSSWKAVDGFDETLYGPEDYDFHNRFLKCGFKWGRISSHELHLGEPKTLYDIWKKHFYYGKQMLFYFRKHPKVSLLQFNPIRVSYFRHYKTFLGHPVLSLGLIIMNATKFLAGGLGLLTAFLTGYRPDFYNPKQ